jgi:hypothetical protein
MYTFTLLTAPGAMGVILSFFSGVRAMVAGDQDSHPRTQALSGCRTVFYMTVFLTILAAPLAR